MIRALRPRSALTPTRLSRWTQESGIATIGLVATTLLIVAVMVGEGLFPGDTERKIAFFGWHFQIDDWIKHAHFPRAAAAIEFLAATLIIARFALRAKQGSALSRGLALLLATCMFCGGALAISRNAVLRPQAVDVRDDFNYLLGTKYFNELGYTRLYPCALTTQIERGNKVPEWVRSLRTSHVYPVSRIADSERIRNRCRKRFSAERWQEFSHDVEQFHLWIEPWHRQWPGLFSDHGFNGPPTLMQLLSVVGNLVPITHFALSVLGLFNLAVVVFMLWLVRWAFRWEAMLAFGIVFFCSNFEAFGHNMSIPRYCWLAAIVAGICCLRRQRYASAAVALVIAAALKGFPGVFLVAALVAIGLRSWPSLRQRPRLAPHHRRFLIAMVITGLTLGVLSIATHHWFGNWRGFLHQMALNGARRAPGCIGYIYNFFVPASGDFDKAKATLEVMVGPVSIGQLAWTFAIALAVAIARHGRWCSEAVFVLGFGFALMHLFTGPVPYYYAGFVGLPLLFAGGTGSVTWRATIVALLCIDAWGNVLTPLLQPAVLSGSFLSPSCTVLVIAFLLVLEYQKRTCSRAGKCVAGP